MLLDANNLPPGSVLTARYCVIGSGMGGATVAQKLARAGQDVLVVEAGSEAPATASDNSSVQSEQVGRSFNMPITRCIELGGTSNQWHGICAPLDEIDFESRPWIEGSGWPISRDELKPFYLEAAALLEIPSSGWFDQQSLPQNLSGRVQDLDFDRQVMQPKLVYNRTPPKRWKGPLAQLAREKVLRCLLNATALELAADGENPAIRELHAGTAEHRLVIRADVFIVCCGGLETPRLLLNSRRAENRGIGNEHDLVGRNLIDHPAGHFCKLKFHRSTSAPLFAGLRVSAAANAIAGLMLRPERQREGKLPNHYVWLRPSVSASRIDDELMLSFLKVRGVRDLTFRQVRAILTNRDILYRILVHRFGVRPKYRYGDLWFMTEQLPNPDSRVQLSKNKTDRHGYAVAKIDWRLSKQDIDQFHAYAKVLFGAGLKGEQYTLGRKDDPDIWDRHVASAAHHLGTARMADNPSRGVVDRHLKVFGASNLFVCDASVFATAGSVNPSLTITALALRLAGHLLGVEV